MRRIPRLMVAAVSVAGACAAGVVSLIGPAQAATARPAITPSVICSKAGPWEIHASAVNLRSQPSTSSTILGILYKGQHFTVHSSTGYWVNLTDTTTGIRGWASQTYVYQTPPAICF